MADKNVIRDMPHSYEAERSLLGCIMIDPKVQVELGGFLAEEDFFTESHKYIFAAMTELLRANKTIDIVTLTDLLEKQGNLRNAGDIGYITELTNVMPSSAQYRTYYDIVKRDAMLRKLIAGSAEIIEECRKSTDEKNSLAVAEKIIYDVSDTADTSEVYKISSVLPAVMTRLDELTKDKSKFHGIKTGYFGLDRILNGFHGSDLMILAARPAVGKTSLAMNIVENIALKGYSCAVFSLEMSKEQLVQRMLCSVAGVNMENMVKGKMQKSEWLKVAKAREMLNNASIYIDESSMISPEEILSKCRRIKRKFGLDFVMIDYIQLMESKGRKEDNRQQEISTISRKLKILAKEINVPVLALSQLSRAVESEKRRPQLSDLRESGAIEQDADIVMFIHRPDMGKSAEKDLAAGKVQKNVAEIIIAKHRNGATGLVKLYFKGECTKFLNINEDTGEPESYGEESKKNAPSVEIRNDTEVSSENSDDADSQIFD